MMDPEVHLKALLQSANFAAAFDVIVDRYSKPLYHHIRGVVQNHEDADDVLQNTFLKVWYALPNFRGDSNLYTWLYRIATNEALSHLRKNRRYSGGELPESKAVVSEELNGSSIQQQFEAALLKLPPKQAIVFRMRYFEDLPYEQMSGILNTSVGALKASYHHAVQKIKTYLLHTLNY
jgi:RNA polymerase sigma-70 factor, ECF subfamily